MNRTGDLAALASKAVLALAVVSCAAFVTAGKPAPRPKVKYTPEQIVKLRAEMHQKMLERTGGYVMKPGVGNGMVGFYNAQTRVSESNLVKVAGMLARSLRIKVVVEHVDGMVTPMDAGARLKKAGAAAGVFIVDDKATPTTLLAAPEGRWAIVNVAALSDDGADEAYVAARTRKEAMRAFLFALNAGDSQSDNSLMGPIMSLQDLDGITATRPPVDVLNRSIRAMPKYGIERWERYTYLEACKEGWAPAPTNEYQRAIWDKIQADKERGPANPIRIPPPNKKK